MGRQPKIHRLHGQRAIEAYCSALLVVQRFWTALFAIPAFLPASLPVTGLTTGVAFLPVATACGRTRLIGGTMGPAPPRAGAASTGAVGTTPTPVWTPGPADCAKTSNANVVIAAHANAKPASRTPGLRPTPKPGRFMVMFECQLASNQTRARQSQRRVLSNSPRDAKAPLI